LYIGSIRLMSRKTTDRELALRHLTALSALRDRVVALCSDGDGRTFDGDAPGAEGRGARWHNLEGVLPAAAREVLPAFDLDAKSVGLKLSVRLSVHRWLDAPLTTPTLPASGEDSLRSALGLWRRLSDARHALLAAEPRSFRRLGAGAAPPGARERRAWSHLRDVFLDVDAECGLDRAVRARRLEQAEEAHASQRNALTSRWISKRLAVEALAERRISTLLARLSRAERHPQPQCCPANAETSFGFCPKRPSPATHAERRFVPQSCAAQLKLSPGSCTKRLRASLPNALVGQC